MASKVDQEVEVLGGFIIVDAEKIADLFVDFKEYLFTCVSFIL